MPGLCVTLFIFVVPSTGFGLALPSYRLPLATSNLFNVFARYHLQILFSPFLIGYQSRPYTIIHSLEPRRAAALNAREPASAEALGRLIFNA